MDLDFKPWRSVVKDLIDGLNLRDLGVYRLKGLPRPECIFQLIIPDLPAEIGCDPPAVGRRVAGVSRQCRPSSASS